MNKYQRVLLIDDNEADIFVNQKLIEGQSFAAKTDVVMSGKAGLDLLVNCRLEELPEIIFLDIMMPVMDGFGFLDRFAELPESVKVKCKIIMLRFLSLVPNCNPLNLKPFLP